jgi:hypothetical protein
MEFKYAQIKDQILFKREIKRQNMVGSFKMFFLRTTGPEKLRFI